MPRFLGERERITHLALSHHFIKHCFRHTCLTHDKHLGTSAWVVMPRNIIVAHWHSWSWGNGRGNNFSLAGNESKNGKISREDIYVLSVPRFCWKKNTYVLQNNRYVESRHWERLRVSIFIWYLKVLSICYSEKPEYKHPKKKRKQVIGVRTQAQWMSIKLFTAWYTENENIWSSWSKSICTVNINLSDPRSAPQTLCHTYNITRDSRDSRPYVKW